jgi:hypothetical protein
MCFCVSGWALTQKVLVQQLRALSERPGSLPAARPSNGSNSGGMSAMTSCGASPPDCNHMCACSTVVAWGPTPLCRTGSRCWRQMLRLTARDHGDPGGSIANRADGTALLLQAQNLTCVRKSNGGEGGTPTSFSFSGQSLHASPFHYAVYMIQLRVLGIMRHVASLGAAEHLSKPTHLQYNRKLSARAVQCTLTSRMWNGMTAGGTQPVHEAFLRSPGGHRGCEWYVTGLGS